VPWSWSRYSMDFSQILTGLVTGLFFAGAIYGGIRADLKSAITCAIEAKATATRAHDRIDVFLAKGH